MREEDYARPLIYNGVKISRKISYTYTRSVFDWLCHSELAILVKGGVGEDAEWEQDVNGVWNPVSLTPSKLILSQELLDLFKEPDRTELVLKSVVEVRNKDGKVVTKKLQEYEKFMIGVLNKYNILSRKIDITLDDKVFNIQLKKIYNNSSLSEGGRNYIIGESLTREERRSLKIDNEDVVEIDFSAMHPRLAAAIDGIELDEYFDPYQIELEGYSSEVARSLGKWCLCMMLNTGVDFNDGKFNFARVRGALIKVLKQHKGSPFNNQELQGQYPEYIDYNAIIRATLERNDYIRSWFYEPKGLFLQNLESKIMDLVIFRFNELEEIILPVHDSIVVQKRLKDYAMDTMMGCYKQVVGSNHNCIITVKEK